ncbi:hypothetical protein M529_23315 [Sphingobium ummariense RL-3]|uniref:Uncharacterized protein n=1 Tax=Sphingobium ummariense RL-3 TaxID=1346791 RepID=T0ILL9_9SPHN|nr:hypothetical protein M529_23315 [Sphingobium ummariense RL-3]
MGKVALATLCFAIEAPQAVAQDENAWTLSGGFDLIETRTGKGGRFYP